MAIVSMADAVSDAVASSAEYNKLIDNIQDLDARMGAVVSGSSAHTRLSSLEALTTDTTTGQGIGNQRLSDRLGTGVGTGTNVTTGSASSQLTDLRSRASALESVTTNVSTGNSALGTRVSALEAATGGAAPFIHATCTTGTTPQSITGTSHATQTWTVVGLNSQVEARGGTFNDAGDYIQVNTAGLYTVVYYCSFQNVANPKALRLERWNGSAWVEVPRSAIVVPVVTAIGAWPSANGAMQVRLLANERIRMAAWVQTTTSLVVAGSATQADQGPLLQLLYAAA